MHESIASRASYLQVISLQDEPNVWKRMQMHTNNDGQLTLSEYREYLASFHDIHDMEQVELVFNNEDANKDGVVTWNEFLRPKGDSPTS
jgi:hypothetical protein